MKLQPNTSYTNGADDVEDMTSPAEVYVAHAEPKPFNEEVNVNDHDQDMFFPTRELYRPPSICQVKLHCFIVCNISVTQCMELNFVLFLLVALQRRFPEF